MLITFAYAKHKSLEVNPKQVTKHYFLDLRDLKMRSEKLRAKWIRMTELKLWTSQ